MKKNILYVILGAIFVLTVSCIIAVDSYTIRQLTKDNERLQKNQKVLLEENSRLEAEDKRYKIADSLNVLKVKELQLSLDEYKKYRKEDLSLIAKLKVDKKELQRIINTQANTISELSTAIKDTTDIYGNVVDSLKVFNYTSTWTDVSGVINYKSDSISLAIQNRESLLIVESIKYKRFLGFLWKTKKIDTQTIDVLSRNPNTTILDASFERIEK